MSAISSSTSAESIRMDYMQLLVAQLQNQNPLEPMDNQDLTAQLATFSQLEQMENQSAQLEGLNSNFEKVLAQSYLGQGTALIGKNVTFHIADENGEVALNEAGLPKEYSGQVDSVRLNDGQVFLNVDDYVLGLDAVLTIED